MFHPSTKRDRREAHKAKMIAKRAAQLSRTPGFVPMDDKQFASTRLRMQMLGQPIVPNYSPLWKRIAAAQSKPVKPHQHAREIARRLRQRAAA